MPQNNKDNHTSTLLFVDDDDDRLQTFKKIFQNKNYTILATSQVDHAVEILSQNPIDMIIAANELPWQGGTNLLQKAYVLQPHSCRVLLGSSPLADSLIHAINDARIQCYVERSWPAKIIQKIIQQELTLKQLFKSMPEASPQLGKKEENINLESILRDRRIRSLFLPIYHLIEGQMIGYEALSRGPLKSPYENPQALLDEAARLGLTPELNNLFFRTAISHSAALSPSQLLFINTLAIPILITPEEQTMVHETPDHGQSPQHFPQKYIKQLVHFIEHHHLKADRIVFEISTKNILLNNNNPYLYKLLDIYRDLGFRLAIDNVGYGDLNIENIFKTYPNFIKIDRMLCRNIHLSEIKRTLVATLVHLAQQHQVECIAEGIENATEKMCLTEMGVTYGQGFLWGKPDYLSPSSFSNFSGHFSKRLLA